MPVKPQRIKNVPVIAVRRSVIFPHTDAILSFGRTKSVAAIESSLERDRIVVIFTQRDPELEDPDFKDLYSTGTLVTVSQILHAEGDINTLVRGQVRVKIEKGIKKKPFLSADVVEVGETDIRGNEVEALTRRLKEQFGRMVNLGKGVEISTVMRLVAGTISPQELVDSVCSILDLKTEEKQKLLDTYSVKQRLTKVVALVAHEIEILNLERRISAKTQQKFSEQTRKSILREKKKTIEKELGEDDEEPGGDLGEYRKKIRKAKMPVEVKEKAEKELKRLSQMSAYNPEGGYLRNYLDWLTEMPWGEVSPNNVSILRAAKVLNNDHYGLKEAKERILEYLAVMKIKKNQKKKDDQAQPTILCFIGPPGVGKTSIGKSIARALGRKFVRISLGGIRDEAEIRGHRRTYVGALPGRIIQGIRNAGTKNPVFMLDEIDKIGKDFRGDPSSALLEALDPEQNREFSDHYLEVPFDLSGVIFIATGNILDTIPPALKDRLEVINFPGYTEDEKLQILKRFLWPKELKAHGLLRRKIELPDKVAEEIVTGYTREAGVRDLERNLATICRKIARQVAEKKKYPRKMTTANLRKFLGPKRFTSLLAEKKDEIGMSTGLAVTPTGGEILFIEVALMPGNGGLTLTGQLGSVMKESAKAAFTWTKSHWQDLGLKKDFAKTIDVHIHVPQGAIPKDGPSAGTAIAIALASALTRKKVRKDVGMTGEVTLRGRVLEIGGIKEKVIAAHQAGLKTIIMPKENKKDLENVPTKTKRDIKFVFAEDLSKVIETAFK